MGVGEDVSENSFWEKDTEGRRGSWRRVGGSGKPVAAMRHSGVCPGTALVAPSSLWSVWAPGPQVCVSVPGCFSPLWHRDGVGLPFQAISPSWLFVLPTLWAPQVCPVGYLPSVMLSHGTPPPGEPLIPSFVGMEMSESPGCCNAQLLKKERKKRERNFKALYNL